VVPPNLANCGENRDELELGGEEQRRKNGGSGQERRFFFFGILHCVRPILQGYKYDIICVFIVETIIN
jgi:hypothetical protein